MSRRRIDRHSPLHDAAGSGGAINTTRGSARLDRRLFWLGSAATLTLPRHATAALPAALPADAARARFLDECYRTGFDEIPILATSLGIDPGARDRGAAGWLHHVEQG